MKKNLLVITLTCLATAAQAQEMRPGRYEYQIKMNMPGLPQAMAQPNFQHCITQKDIQDGKAFQARQDTNSDCRIEGMTRKGAEISYRMVCTKPQAMSADVKGRMTADTMDMVMDMKMQQGGQAMQIRQQMLMKRLGDC